MQSCRDLSCASTPAGRQVLVAGTALSLTLTLIHRTALSQCVSQLRAEQGRGEYLEQLGLSFMYVYVLQFYGLPVEEKTILSNTQNTFTV